MYLLFSHEDYVGYTYYGCFTDKWDMREHADKIDPELDMEFQYVWAQPDDEQPTSMFSVCYQPLER
ncbi:MAG: hypothetical protein ACWGQW_04205 [bacterium]